MWVIMEQTSARIILVRLKPWTSHAGSNVLDQPVHQPMDQLAYPPPPPRHAHTHTHAHTPHHTVTHLVKTLAEFVKLYNANTVVKKQITAKYKLSIRMMLTTAMQHHGVMAVRRTCVVKRWQAQSERCVAGCNPTVWSIFIMITSRHIGTVLEF